MLLKRVAIVPLVILLAACAAQARTTGQFTVNGRSVSVALYNALVAAERQKVERTGIQLRAQSPGDRARVALIESSVIRELIRDAVVEQLAEARGIRVTASDLQQRLSAAEQAFGGANGFQQALEQADLSRADFASVLRYRILEAQLVTAGGAGSTSTIITAVARAHVVVTIGPCAGNRAYPACLSPSQ